MGLEKRGTRFVQLTLALRLGYAYFKTAAAAGRSLAPTVAPPFPYLLAAPAVISPWIHA